MSIVSRNAFLPVSSCQLLLCSVPYYFKHQILASFRQDNFIQCCKIFDFWPFCVRHFLLLKSTLFQGNLTWNQKSLLMITSRGWKTFNIVWDKIHTDIAGDFRIFQSQDFCGQVKFAVICTIIPVCLQWHVCKSAFCYFSWRTRQHISLHKSLHSNLFGNLHQNLHCEN